MKWGESDMTNGELYNYVRKQMDGFSEEQIDDWRPAAGFYIDDIVKTDAGGSMVPYGIRLWLTNGDSVIYAFAGGDLGKHGHAEMSQEQTKKAVVLSKNEVTGICKNGTSKGKKLVCQFKNGVDTQLFSADEILQWMNSDKYVYGKTWRCWSDTPSLQQEKETPWEALWETDGSTSKPPLGCAPRYTYVCSRIEDLCNAIVRCYADWKPNHNKIAMWCKEIMYLNEMDRSLRYEEKRKVWKEDKDGHLQEVP